jgi:site-specific DNA-methyltransferase (adenine-specific)
MIFKDKWVSDCGRATLYLGDCLDVLKSMPDNSVDSIVSDPPYGLSFMGRAWDYDVPAVEVWAECLRVLKPGGHLLAFAGTRTQHRMAVNIEDAGFEIRDMIAWIYGQGFPKSHDISKAIDKEAGAEREVVAPSIHHSPGRKATNTLRSMNTLYRGVDDGKYITAPSTSAACQWQGWGTALKPALEPVTVARKPIAANTVASNVLEWGTGGINVDGCRIEGDMRGGNQYRSAGNGRRNFLGESAAGKSYKVENHPKGRFPSNLVHDGSDEVLAGFPETHGAGNIKESYDDPAKEYSQNSIYQGGFNKFPHNPNYHKNNGGSSARFFYVPKASKRDRDEGCEGMEERIHQSGMGGAMPIDDDGNERDRFKAMSRNFHPTVKPTDLMRYLCRLVTPPGGIVLDPFMGSGSTGKGAVLEGFRFVGIEMDEKYMEIAKARVLHVLSKQAEIFQLDNAEEKAV